MSFPPSKNLRMEWLIPLLKRHVKYFSKKGMEVVAQAKLPGTLVCI